VTDIFTPGAHVHIMGCAGAGMSALAQLLHERGLVVTGCDLRDGDVAAQLRASGVDVAIGHSAAHIDTDVAYLTASPAVPAEHEEVRAALAAGVSVLRRPDVLGALGEAASVVGVAGTHGKTTTTSMLAAIFHAAGRDPGRLLGAPVAGVGDSGHWGKDPEVLVEVDESYGTFAQLSPAALGLLNVDPDHLDFYGDLATLEAAFTSLVERTRGPVVVWVDHVGAARVVERSAVSAVSVGRDPATADVLVTDETWDRDGSTFSLRFGDEVVKVRLQVPGSLNVANAAVAAVLARECGIPSDAIVAGLAQFRGAPRRFERRASIRGVDVVDDYAHLPLEVHETIRAARAAGYKSIVAVFQPHRVTRTTALAPEFAGAFAGVRDLVVTDIYRAGEPNPDNIDGSLVANAVRDGVDAPEVLYVGEMDEAGRTIATLLAGADLLLVLGAGDVTKVLDYVVAS